MGSVDLCAGSLGDARPLAVGGHGRADPGRLLLLGVQQRHVGDVDRALALDDARLGVGVQRRRALVALDDVQPRDLDALPGLLGAQDLAGLALVLAADDDHLVVAADAHLVGHQSTSGASEMIFMKPPSRSSRATGPKMRVPRGLFWASMITAAFSSKAMYVPSSRPNSFFVRTTTALTTSPFLTVPFGLACLTVATMMSPTPAYRRREPPMTRIVRISRAPVLSATRSRVSFWIIEHAPAHPADASAWCATSDGTPGRAPCRPRGRRCSRRGRAASPSCEGSCGSACD